MLPTIEPGVKICLQMPPEPTEDDLKFAHQLGVTYAVTGTNETKSSYDYYSSRRKLFADHGITLYGFGNSSVHNMDAVTLNLPNRDAKVAQYKQHIRDLGKAGIPYTTYAHMANGIWSSEREEIRGGASARALNLDANPRGHWAGTYYTNPLSHGRRYTQEEIWANYQSFIEEVVPVAEEAGVKIGFHPDDPPQPELAGVPRCIFSNHDGYQRALDIADSPNIGICFCVGCWLEGGPLMGKGVLESIEEFGQQGKIYKVHFRNVNQPLPHFVETYIDDGYFDMYPVMKKLVEINFDGVVIPDHVPLMLDNPRLGTAYTIGWMQALLKRAQEEVAADRAAGQAA